MNDLPCVDVVIPVFNGRQTIQAALDSVLAHQGNWVRKVIVIDDGSTDATADVVSLIDSPLIELVRTPNQGVAAARNLGIDKSTAEWIAFLDADDVWMPGKLDAQLAAARAHGAGFVCGAVSRQSKLPTGPVSPRLLARGNFVATSSVLVKREVVQVLQPLFTPGMSFAEDYLAWLKCVTLTPGHYLASQLVDYILSERPRYRWGNILRSLVAVNVLYAGFLRNIGALPARRLCLGWALFWGSLRSVLSITKRFINSYNDGA